ncbi:MAG TPA: tetratricopeptide repeat protein [Acidobacteriaceae bacterium]|nr:tetratricopeptide repeat protein [Acidobacteriaceae bacterium]
MIASTKPSGQEWTLRWASIFAAGCLIAGIGGGWVLRQSYSGAPTPEAVAAAPAAAAGQAKSDAAAAPLLAKLQADPNNADLLISVGNLYYDAQQYPAAVEYYARALTVRPSDADVRTDMGTAYWYMGNADRAIAEFNQALLSRPDNANTLFNLGLVMLQGKNDAAAAIGDWRRLLAADPEYPQRQQVEQMIAQAENESARALR